MDRPLFLCLTGWRQAGGIPFRADSAPFFCPECLWGTFRAGFGAFSCPGGGWYPILRRKRCLFLLQMPLGHLPRRIWGIFLPGRRLVFRSAQVLPPFPAPNASGVPSAQDLGHFPARQAVVAHSAQEKMPFSAPNASGAPSAQDLGHFPARQAVGIPFRAGFAAFSCPKCLWGTFRAGFRAFSCPEGGWYPILSVGKMQL